MPPVKKMSEEGTVTPEVKLKEVENRLIDETDRLRKLYSAYESQEKELIDIKLGFIESDFLILLL